jgi:hypothetical protein
LDARSRFEYAQNCTSNAWTGIYGGSRCTGVSTTQSVALSLRGHSSFVSDRIPITADGAYTKLFPCPSRSPGEVSGQSDHNRMPRLEFLPVRHEQMGGVFCTRDHFLSQRFWSLSQ